MTVESDVSVTVAVKVSGTPYVEGLGLPLAATSVTLVLAVPTVCVMAGEAALNVIGAAVPELITSSADLTPSNNTKFKDEQEIRPDDFSGRYISFADLSSAIAHTISAVAQRQLSPRAATSIAYLSQTLYQSISRAESDYVRTFGVDAWKRTLAHNLSAPALDDAPVDEPE